MLHKQFLFGIFTLFFFLSCSTKEKPRQTLTILLPEDILTLDPNKEFETITDSVLFNVFEPLVGLDENLHLQPILAESWENPTQQEWRFHLRKGVRFHDGKDLNANIVLEALNLVRKSPDLETSAFLISAREMKAIDDYTLSIITEKPYAILSKLPFIYITKSNKTGTFPALVGTGPYRFTEWKSGQSITLTRWEQYYGGIPAFQEVHFLPVLDIAKRYEMMKNHQGDMMYGLPAEWARSKIDGVKVIERPGLTVYYLGFNLATERQNPFKDERVRRAVHLATNRQEIVRTALLGFGTVATQPVAPFVFGYDPNLAEPKHNLAEAKSLMAQAGWSEGFKVRLDFSHPRLRAAELLQQQLKQIKIDVSTKALQKNSFYDLLEAGQSDFYLAGWDCTSGDASEFYEFCLHSRTQGLGLGNYTGYYNAEMDTIAETNTSIRNERGRREMLQTAAAITMRDLPVVPLYIENDIYAVRDDLFFEPRADSEIKVKDVRSVAARERDKSNDKF